MACYKKLYLSIIHYQIQIQHRSGYKLLTRFNNLFMNTNVKRKGFLLFLLRNNEFLIILQYQSYQVSHLITLCL